MTSNTVPTHPEQCGISNPILLRKAGFALCEPRFEGLSRLTLKTLFMAPSAVRQEVLFGQSKACYLVQILVQKLLGGPRPARLQFAEGPARGSWLDCSTSEKYFLMGTSYERGLGQKRRQSGHLETVC